MLLTVLTTTLKSVPSAVSSAVSSTSAAIPWRLLAIIWRWRCPEHLPRLGRVRVRGVGGGVTILHGDRHVVPGWPLDIQLGGHAGQVAVPQDGPGIVHHPLVLTVEYPGDVLPLRVGHSDQLLLDTDPVPPGHHFLVVRLESEKVDPWVRPPPSSRSPPSG